MISWIAYGAAVALLVALAPLPYPFYPLLRIAVTVAAAALATHSFRAKRLGWAWLMVFVGLLFNPITPVSLGRQIWMAVDALTAATFLAAGYSTWGFDGGALNLKKTFAGDEECWSCSEAYREIIFPGGSEVTLTCVLLVTPVERRQ